MEITVARITQTKFGATKTSPEILGTFGHIWAHFNDNGDTNGRSSVVHHIMFVVMCELRGIYSAFHKFQNTRPRMPFLYRHTLLPSRINSLNSKAMVPT